MQKESHREHYFAEAPTAKHKTFTITAELKGRYYSFLSDSSIFSKKKVDSGTALLIKHMQIDPNDMVLDLGCGYGVIGIVAADIAKNGGVYLVDVNRRAVELAVENIRQNRINNAVVLQGDGLEPVADKLFDKIVTCSPP